MPPLKGLSFRCVSQPLTAHPWTRHFRHMEPIPRHWYGRINPQVRVGLKAIPPKDRIKFWNIVPGDKIRLRGDGSSKIREVIKINKLDNTVHIKKERGKKVWYPKVPYARCQLFLGNHFFPPRKGSDEPSEVPVFALRVARRNTFWSRQLGRWHWDRIATATIPRLARLKEPRVIPWPEFKPRPKQTGPGPYDTTKEALLQVTYMLPPLPASPTASLPRPPSEHDYIRSLFNPQAIAYDASRPMELALHRELANPHSRAKKQARWQDREAQNKKLLEEFVQAEVRVLNGRTVREAKADGAWKWREFLAKQARENKVKKLKNRGTEERKERKRVRKERKVRKEKERLNELVLAQGRNQFIPPGVTVAPV